MIWSLVVYTWSGSGATFRQAETYREDEVHGYDVPRVGDTLTVHPSGEPGYDSFTCAITAVQRVLRKDWAGMHIPLASGELIAETAVCVTGKIQGT